MEHAHCHVIPRRTGDMEDPEGGVRHVIPEKGNYIKNDVKPDTKLFHWMDKTPV